MVFAVVSDIHSNLEAFEAVLADIDSRGIRQIYCLGDIIGYGPDPARCLDLISERAIQSVIGNHDEAVLKPELTASFNALATKAINWTRSQLSDIHLDLLKQLQEKLILDKFLLIHGALTGAHNYINSEREAEENLTIFKKNFPELQICFFGHTHISSCFGEDRLLNPTHDCSVPVELNRNLRYLINPGACGQPRDGFIEAAYGIFDSTAFSYSHVRVPYDQEITRRKIYDNPELPDFLGDRLLRGR